MKQLSQKNKATDIRRELMRELLKLFFEDRMDELDELPFKLYPYDQKPFRCCIHKDRYIIRARLLAILGHSIEDDDERVRLSDYAKTAMEREKIQEPMMTFINDACSSCVTVNYYVTDVCKGCVARPCKMNCPKTAISVLNNKALINPVDCVNCGICKDVCPYNAIVYIPVPCEQGCPVDAVKQSDNGKHYIDYKECMYCGACTRNCPFGAIMEKTQILDVARKIRDDVKIVAMVAPSIVGQFPGELGNIIGAIKKVGFDSVIEVAMGADTTAKEEANEFENMMNDGKKMMGTSCCPAYIETVKKHVNEFSDYVSKTRTPMSYTGEYAREKYPGSITVFIGPCITKKFEGINDDLIDYVLTYEELNAFIEAKGIDVAGCEKKVFDNQDASVYGKGFAVSNGVGEAVKHYCSKDVKPVVIDGLDKSGIEKLRDYAVNEAPGNLIEVMSCKPLSCLSLETLGNLRA